jgi:hypothetical protein
MIYVSVHDASDQQPASIPCCGLQIPVDMHARQWSVTQYNETLADFMHSGKFTWTGNTQGTTPFVNT